MSTFIKGLLFGSLFLVASSVLGAPAITVQCTNNISHDRPAIQAAVDAAGSNAIITIKGLCQMDGHRVFITKSNLTVQGVRGPVDLNSNDPGFGRPTWLTTIKGLVDPASPYGQSLERFPVPATLPVSGNDSATYCSDPTLYATLTGSLTDPSTDVGTCAEYGLYWNRPMLITVPSGSPAGTVIQNVTVKDLKFQSNKRGVEINSDGGPTTGNMCTQTFFSPGVNANNITVKENWFDDNHRGPQVFGSATNIFFLNNLVTRINEEKPGEFGGDTAGMLAVGGGIGCSPIPPALFGNANDITLGGSGPQSKLTFAFNDIRTGVSQIDPVSNTCIRCGSEGISFEGPANSTILGNNITSEDEGIFLDNTDASNDGQPSAVSPGNYNTNDLIAFNHIYNIAGFEDLRQRIAFQNPGDLPYFPSFTIVNLYKNAIGGILLGESPVPGLVNLYPYDNIGPGNNVIAAAVGNIVAFNSFDHNTWDVAASEGAGGNTVIQPGAKVIVACRCLQLVPAADWISPPNALPFPGFVDTNGNPLNIPASNFIIPATPCTVMHVNPVDKNGHTVLPVDNSLLPPGTPPAPSLDLSICNPGH